ncbi:MAG: FKBP-type peptidyl-prolyl cis-trans isomerase [Alphaproteobacteria bacterium]
MRIFLAACALAGLAMLASCNQGSDVAGEIARQDKAEADTVGQNLADGQQFLATNKVRPGVLTTASGLQYEIVKKGDQGKPAPGPNDTVNVMYEGALTDGKVFDSSYQRKEPVQFPVGRVIAGWTEALQLMHPGEEIRLVIPPQLGYGEDGSPPDIPPNSVLVFRVELLGYQNAAGLTVGAFPE